MERGTRLKERSEERGSRLKDLKDGARSWVKGPKRWSWVKRLKKMELGAGLKDLKDRKR